jgi:hypothetical protein
VIRWPTSRRSLYTLKTHSSQIERLDKRVDHPNKVALVNETIKAAGTKIVAELLVQIQKQEAAIRCLVVPNRKSANAGILHLPHGTKLRITDVKKLPTWLFSSLIVMRLSRCAVNCRTS